MVTSGTLRDVLFEDIFTIVRYEASGDPRCRDPEPQWGSDEAGLRDWLQARARDCGFAADTEQTLCLDGARWGRADLIVGTTTATPLVEVKQTLNRQNLRHALGQVYGYKACGFAYTYLVARSVEEIPYLDVAVAAHRFDVAVIPASAFACLLVSEEHVPGFLYRDWHYRKELAAAWARNDPDAHFNEPVARFVHDAFFNPHPRTPEPEPDPPGIHASSRDVYGKPQRAY